MLDRGPARGIAQASRGHPGPSRTPRPEPVIEVADLVKRYRHSDANAVDGVSFEVGAGEFFALLGPNGAGKNNTI